MESTGARVRARDRRTLLRDARKHPDAAMDGGRWTVHGPVAGVGEADRRLRNDRGSCCSRYDQVRRRAALGDEGGEG
eukprot:6999060-Heterocapsa_arctica.AAC.1